MTSPKLYRVKIPGKYGRHLYLRPMWRGHPPLTSSLQEAEEFSSYAEARKRARGISTKRIKAVVELIEEAEAFKQVTGEAA